MNYGQRQAVVGLLLFAGFLAGCDSSAETGADEEAPRLVDTTRVLTAGDGLQVTFSGRVRSVEEASLSFEVAGEVETVTVDVGDSFEAGDRLAVLDDERYQLAHEQSVAAEKEAKASLDESRLAFERQQRLSAKNFASQSRLDSTRAALETARARYESAVVSRRVAVRDLQEVTLEAPFPGTVTRRLVEPSERVTPNQTILETVSSRAGFEVVTHIPENLVGKLRKEEIHTVSIPALGGEMAAARIKHLGKAPLSSNNYPVVLEIEGPAQGLRSGLTAKVHLSIGNGDDGRPAAGAVRVPLTALIHDGNQGGHVLRLNSGNRLEAVSLEILGLDGRHVRVAGDLASGDRIVARGVEFVSPGDPVAVLGQGNERFH